MSEEQIIELINKIKDDKLKEYIKAYRLLKNPLQLLGILDYLNVKIRTDAISAIIPQFVVDNIDIWLGGIILHGRLFRFILRVYDDDLVIDMYEASDIILYEEKKNEKEH